MSWLGLIISAFLESCYTNLNRELTLSAVDIFTASTVILAVMVSEHAQVLCPDAADPLETTWKRAMEILAVYEKDGVAFARQCAWTLQTALEQGLRDTRSESRGSYFQPTPTSSECII